MLSHAELDKYYTKPSVAQECYVAFKGLFQRAGLAATSCLFVEPSAGSGSFLNLIKEPKIGFDLVPEDPAVIKLDFLRDDIRPYLSCATPIRTNKTSIYRRRRPFKRLVFLGNPPFGRKAHLAISFVNQALSYGHTVGFILPLQLRKWSGQKRVLPNARLILDHDLPENSFALMGKNYPVRCCFQVWSTDPLFAHLTNLRLTMAPATAHGDFAMYQYNRTEEAKKYFDHDWDFAVLRQGYGDYTKKYFKKEDCDFKQQWIFFKASSPEVLNNLLSLDFVKLSRKNIGIPGFGKADVIQEYQSLFD